MRLLKRLRVWWRRLRHERPGTIVSDGEGWWCYSGSDIRHAMRRLRYREQAKHRLSIWEML